MTSGRNSIKIGRKTNTHNIKDNVTRENPLVTPAQADFGSLSIVGVKKNKKE